MGFYANQDNCIKTKVSSEKNVTYLELRDYFGQKKVKKPVAQNYLFYRNIVCRKSLV